MLGSRKMSRMTLKTSWIALALLSLTWRAAADPIHACVMKSNGKLRVVADASMCKSSETAVDLNPDPRRISLVGFTTASIAGNAGALELTRTCEAEFAGSRVCWSADVYLDFHPPAISNPGDFAWVLPTVIGSAASPIDASGTQLPVPGCSTISAPSNIGLVVDGHGRYSQATCSETHRVACCR